MQAMYQQASVVQAMLDARVFRTPGPVVDVILEDGETPNPHRGRKREQAGYARTMRYAVAFDGKDFDSGEEKVEVGRTWRVDGPPHQRQTAERIAELAREAQAAGEGLVLWKLQYEAEGEKRFDLVWAERARSRPSDDDGRQERRSSFKPVPPRQERPASTRGEGGHPLRGAPRSNAERIGDPSHGEPFGAPEEPPELENGRHVRERSTPPPARPSPGAAGPGDPLTELRARFGQLDGAAQRRVRNGAKAAGVRIATNPEEGQVATVLGLVDAELAKVSQ